jgi:hypothetical protein
MTTRLNVGSPTGPDLQQLGQDLHQFAHDVTNAIKDLQLAVTLLSLGVDLSRWMKFVALTPVVVDLAAEQLGRTVRQSPERSPLRNASSAMISSSTLRYVCRKPTSPRTLSSRHAPSQQLRDHSAIGIDCLPDGLR